MSTRMLLAGWVVLFGMASASASAQPHPPGRREAAAKVRFTFSKSPDAATLAAEGLGARLSKRASRSGVVTTISAEGDQLELTATPDGVVTLKRGARVVIVRADATLADHGPQVRALTEGSAALRSLNLLTRAVMHTQSPHAFSVLATSALVRALHGDDAGNDLLAQKIGDHRAARLRTVAQVRRDGENTVWGCYEEYERTLDRNLERYNTCLREYWWAQPIQYACGLEFALIAELAIFRLISCTGGFPLP